MAVALAETPKQELEEARRWWTDYIEARRIPALQELPQFHRGDEWGAVLERLFSRMSRERVYLTSMAGAFPLPLSWELIDRTLRGAGIDGDLLDLAHVAIDMMDASFVEGHSPKSRDDADGPDD